MLRFTLYLNHQGEQQRAQNTALGEASGYGDGLRGVLDVSLMSFKQLFLAFSHMKPTNCIYTINEMTLKLASLFVIWVTRMKSMVEFKFLN